MNARLLRHNLKKVPSTKAYAPWKIIYTESYPTRGEASTRGKAFKKKKSRIYIESNWWTRPDVNRDSQQCECGFNSVPGY